MQLAAVFLVFGLAVFVVLYLYAPFQERRTRHVTVDEQELSTLLAERERTLNALQELDFDYKLGKVPEEDYPIQRTNLLQKGAEILRRLDELAPQKTQADEEARIEHAIASRRRKTSGNGISDDDLESLIVKRRKARKNKTGGFCPKCGRAVLASDKFCPSCGRALS